VNHQVQQLGDFGLEGVGLGGGLFCHGGDNLGVRRGGIKPVGGPAAQ
jgi:hypothetical protein